MARSGLLARLAAAGLAGRPLDPDDQGRRSLAAFTSAASIFVTVGFAIWAQLTIGWQWSAPNTVGTASAMIVMTFGAVTIGAACVACAVPVAWLTVHALVVHRPWEILRPLCLVGVGLAVLIVGAHHFANGWPRNGEHPWADQGIVPGGVAAYAWASTLFVTSYWLHPAALGTLPGTRGGVDAGEPTGPGSRGAWCGQACPATRLPDRVLRFEQSSDHGC